MGLLAWLGWLLAAMTLARATRRPWPRGMAAVLAGIAGTTLPDVDLLLPLGHRSALTHSLLPLLLVAMADSAMARRHRPAPADRTAMAGPVVAGLAIGLGLHLAADCFPHAMRGFATVKLPFAGSIGAGASYAWLGSQSAAATLAGVVLLAKCLPPRVAGVAAVLLVAVGIGYLHATDGGWPTLCLYAAFGWVAVRRRSTSGAISR